jgi:lipid A 3-O-deacylase
VWSLVIENDSITSDSDRHFTHGTRLSYLSTPLEAKLDWGLPGSTAQLNLELGQNIFTPRIITTPDPDPRERPYAGWLYVGAGLVRERDGAALDHAALQLGIVGPDAQGDTVQNNWHQLIGARTAAGWPHQLKDEPGLVLFYERKWRFEHKLGDDFTIDAIPQASMSLGNVLTYGAVGGMVRFGENIGFDYGPTRIQPALSGTDWFKPPDRLGWYAFVGTETRFVARNIFLDGNTFRSSPHVAKEAAVADLQLGIAATYADWLRLAFSWIYRTDEFVAQNRPDRFTAVSLSLRF